jgi:DNA primase
MIGKPKYFHCPNFKRNHYLYGEHLYDCTCDEAHISEGFFDAIRLRASGLKNTFAMMGTHLSDIQIRKLKGRFQQIVIWPDGDDPGLDAGITARKKLSECNLKVRLVDVKKYWGKDPGDLTQAEVLEVLNSGDYSE